MTLCGPACCHSDSLHWIPGPAILHCACCEYCAHTKHAHNPLVQSCKCLASNTCTTWDTVSNASNYLSKHASACVTCRPVQAASVFIRFQSTDKRTCSFPKEKHQGRRDVLETQKVRVWDFCVVAVRWLGHIFRMPNDRLPTAFVKSRVQSLKQVCLRLP